jgi:hypothetical protein
MSPEASLNPAAICCRLGLFSVLIAALIAMSLTSCKHAAPSTEEARVKKAFDSCKQGLIDNRPDKVSAYLPRNVDDYLNQLKAGTRGLPPRENDVPKSESPTVDYFLRTALEQKVPDNLRPNLTVAALLQRIAEERLIDPKDIQPISIGPVSVNGDHASAEIYYQGNMTPVNLPFSRENGTWKIDILSALPYIEMLMRLDRAVARKSETEQVEFLVRGLPSL